MPSIVLRTCSEQNRQKCLPSLFSNEQDILKNNINGGFSGGSDGEESICNAGDPVSVSWVRKIPWRKEWLPTSVFLPGEFHKGAQQATVHGVAKSWTQLSD